MKPLLCILAIVFFNACTPKYLAHESEYAFTDTTSVPDYGNLYYWAAHPSKHDLSDSVPKPLLANYDPNTVADIFFIHPTTFIGNNESSTWNADINDSRLNAKTDYSTILLQASIFNEAGLIYAPRYRQAHFRSYFPTTAADTVAALAAFNLAYDDVRRAFVYYLEHNNHGRPIVIASHSQGTNHAMRLMKEFFDGKPLQKQLVAAYLIGMPVDPDYFSSIEPCNGPLQTGCFCSWRTLRAGYLPEYIVQEPYNAVVTNPLTWRKDEPVADRSKNKGSILLHFNKLNKHVASAEVTDKVLWTSKPHFFGNILFRKKNYHIADLNLYYLSVRENVNARVRAFVRY